MLVLHVQAPFAAFRPFVAGSYRNTAPFITPSAAYGLLLNIAGIESRFDDGHSMMTLLRPHLPSTSIAVGMISEPQVCSLYQQLHSYPPGEGKKTVDPATGRKVGERELGLARTRLGKWRITPVRRELLCGINGYIAMKDNDALEQQVRDGLGAGIGRRRVDERPRYGIPFLGDNSYLIDRLSETELQAIRPAAWFCPLRDLPSNGGPTMRPGTCRMTTYIDRADMSQTRSDLYAPIEWDRREVPDAAWTKVGSSAE